MMKQMQKTETLVLVEGAAWGDAEFYGRWLLDAAKANDLLIEGKDDDEFRKRIETLEEYSDDLDFGIMAIVFLSQFSEKELHSFVLETDLPDLKEFVLMAEMGFFTLTGDRYQMTLPSNLDLDTVKQACVKLAETKDEDWIHPQRLLVAISRSQAEKYQRLLRNVSQAQRLADRRALLFLD